MKRDVIIELIKKLAASQGFYGRLQQAIKAINDMDNNDKNALFEHLEAQNFADHIDLIMYLEG